MLSVSPRFLPAIPRHPTYVTTCTATPPGGSPTALTLAAGSATADRTQRIRRTATLQVKGGSALYELLSTPGTRIAIDHGIRYRGIDQELLPQLRGELSSAAVTLGDGLIQIAVADLWQGLVGAEYLTAFSPDSGAGRVDTIIAAVRDVYPGIEIRNAATDSGAVGTVQAWTSRADLITAYANDGGMDAYFAPDGAFVLRDMPQITDPIAWRIKTGDGGTLESLTRSRPLDRLYNAVILTPATADASQDWDQVIAVITDPSNPRHPDRVGRIIPFRYASPTLLTEDEALNVAELLLTKVQGSSETLALGALANPALEPGDIVRVLTPIDGGNTIVSHFLDSLAIDFVTGSMSCATRASEEVAA